LALTVAALDASKGMAAVWWALAAGASDGPAAAAGVAAVIGHAFPIWTRFRGGKGVATAFGAFFALAPIASLAALGSFVLTVWVTRYVSVGSVIASLLLPPATILTHASAPIVIAAVIAAGVVVVRHRENLARLQRGDERRLGERPEQL
jgi:glycerol-3-phosphate acyltransferase PlsY